MSAMDISDEGAKSVIVADIESLLRGALLAKQSGREIDIINSFELPPHPDLIDRAYLATKQEQLKQVFPQLDFMGWYSVGVAPTETDLKLHDQVNESSLFLQLNPVSLASGAKEFPVSIYESIIDVHDARLMFIKVPYKVETNEAERVAVDHVAKPSVSGAEASLSGALVSHLTTQRNAIAMLYGKIRFLYQYLEDAKNGVVPMDHDIVRQISSLCQRLPLMDSKAFDDQFSTESDDVLLMAYLATITTGVNTMNDLIDKFNLVYGGSGSSGQMQGGSKKGRRMFPRGHH
ncbi:COP9 signalosome complex subunit 6 [Apophysomyces sp. BC1021]|nr:COP9 signalosome complex subunit 6 [Apophysomyces sp. BC1021]